MSENTQQNPVMAALSGGMGPMREDYRSGGPKALLRNRAAQVAGGTIIVLMLLLSMGGTASEVDIKGLRLGMNMEDAARGMLDHGLPPGGPAEWDESRAGIRLVRQEYTEAAKAHASERLKALAKEQGVETPLDLIKLHMKPGVFEELERAHQTLSLQTLSFDRPDEFMDQWALNELPPLLKDEDRFTPFDDYLAQNYPDGPTYALGGPWDGEEPLEPVKNADGTKSLMRKAVGTWTIISDENDKVVHIMLLPSAVDALFNTGDASAEEFADGFASSYDVPLELYTQDVDPVITQYTGEFFRTGWAYLDRDNGWTLTIGQDKRLDLKRITKSAEQSFH